MVTDGGYICSDHRIMHGDIENLYQCNTEYQLYSNKKNSKNKTILFKKIKRGTRIWNVNFNKSKDEAKTYSEPWGKHHFENSSHFEKTQMNQYLKSTHFNWDM